MKKISKLLLVILLMLCLVGCTNNKKYSVGEISFKIPGEWKTEIGEDDGSYLYAYDKDDNYVFQILSIVFEDEEVAIKDETQFEEFVSFYKELFGEDVVTDCKYNGMSGMEIVDDEYGHEFLLFDEKKGAIYSVFFDDDFVDEKTIKQIMKSIK